jgi:hypothetical protein
VIELLICVPPSCSFQKQKDCEFQASQGRVRESLSQKQNTRNKRSRDVPQVVEHMTEALCSMFVPQNKQINKPNNNNKPSNEINDL